MPINADTRAVNGYLDKVLGDYQEAIAYNMAFAGETAVNAQRHKHGNDYNDQTGNLRSSVGYVLSRNGKLGPESGFEAVRGPKGSGEKGVEGGKSYARELAERETDEYALVVVAGMDYAGYVKEMGYDVLDTAEKVAIDTIKRRFKRIGIQ